MNFVSKTCVEFYKSAKETIIRYRVIRKFENKLIGRVNL